MQQYFRRGYNKIKEEITGQPALRRLSLHLSARDQFVL